MISSKFFPVIFIIGIWLIFFYRVIFFGSVPFPGDLLLSEYSPYKFISFFGYNPGSIPHKAQYFDTALQLFPWRSFSISSIQEFVFPLWNPYNFSGTPLFANNQSAVLYPLGVLYLVLPQTIAWSILVMLQPLMACIFTYLYLKRLGKTQFASLFSGIVYGFSLFMTVFLEYNSIGHSIAFLPLSLYVYESYKKQLQVRYLFLFVFSLVSTFFAGHLQVSAVLFGFVFLYVINDIFSLKRPLAHVSIWLFPVLFFLSLVIASVQLIPTAELIFYSSRISQETSHILTRLLTQPSQLFMFFAPDIFGNPVTRNFLPGETYPTKAFYIGILPVLFILVSLANFKKDTHVRFFSLTIGILLVFLIRNPISTIFYHFDIPLFSSSSPSNMWFLFSFSGAVLAGFGLDVFLKDTIIKKRIVAIFISLFLGFFAVSFLMIHEYMQIKQILIPLGILSLFGIVYVLFKYKRLSKIILCFAVLLITALDLMYYFQKFNPFVSQEMVYPKTAVVMYLQEQPGFQRMWGIGSANIPPNLHSEFQLFSPLGYDPLYPRVYGEFIQSIDKGEFINTFTNETRSNVSLGDAFEDGDLMRDAKRLKVLDFLGVTYILDREEEAHSEKTFPSDTFLLSYQSDGFKIFTNIHSFPRVFFVKDVKNVKTPEMLFPQFYSQTFNPRETALVYEDVDVSELESSTSATISMYQGNKIEILTEVDEDAFLVLTDTYYKGWKAFVGEKETPIYQVDHAFRGVLVPKGTEIVRFVYTPWSFTFGLTLSIIGIASLAVMLFFINRLSYGK